MISILFSLTNITGTSAISFYVRRCDHDYHYFFSYYYYTYHTFLWCSHLSPVIQVIFFPLLSTPAGVSSIYFLHHCGCPPGISCLTWLLRVPSWDFLPHLTPAGALQRYYFPPRSCECPYRVCYIIRISASLLRPVQIPRCSCNRFVILIIRVAPATGTNSALLLQPVCNSYYPDIRVAPATGTNSALLLQPVCNFPRCSCNRFVISRVAPATVLSGANSFYADGGIPPQQGKFLYRQLSSAMVVDIPVVLTGGPIIMPASSAIHSS